MEDNINFWEMEDDPSLKQIKNSTVTSGNLTNTTTKEILAQLQKQNSNQPSLAVT